MAQTYTVKSGDSLSKISEMFYGNWSGVDAIAKANNITNVNVIYPGQVLSIPDKSGVTNSNAASVQDAVVVSETKSSLPLIHITEVFLLGGLGLAAFLIWKKEQNKKKGKGKTKK